MNVNLLREYVKELLETSNPKFLEELKPIYDEYMELQSKYGKIGPKYYETPEGDVIELETQTVDPKDQPDYVKDAPEYYAGVSDHPSTRRATFSQTQAEVELEKKLLRLFQKYADQKFFDSITIYHDLNYVAALQQPIGSDLLNFADFKRTDYFKMEGKRNKDVMSCHGSVDGSIPGSYGMILKGRVIFASRGDLGSQTLRTAHEKVAKKYASSGLPKRTGPEKIHPTKKDIERRLRFAKRRYEFDKKRGKEVGKEPMEEDIIEALNLVVLGPQDVKGNNIEEILLANWTIEGWYCDVRDGGPFPRQFWEEAVKAGIKKPVYEIGSVPLKEIDLNAALNESLVRDYVKEELSEWMLANDDNLMLNKDDGMEEPYRKKISDYLKAMGILDG